MTRFAQKCVCFTNPCINVPVLNSFTREYHTKVLELLDLLLGIAALAACTELGLWRGIVPCLYSANFHSVLVARSWKPIKCMMETLFRGYKQWQIVQNSKWLIRCNFQQSHSSTRLWMINYLSYSYTAEHEEEWLQPWMAEPFSKRGGTSARQKN